MPIIPNKFYDPLLVEDSIIFMRKAVKLFLEYGSKIKGVTLSPDQVIEANETLEKVNDDTTPRDEIIAIYKDIVKGITTGGAQDSILFIPLMFSIKEIPDGKSER